MHVHAGTAVRIVKNQFNGIGFDNLGIRSNLFDIYGIYVRVDQKVLVLSVNCDGLLYAKMTFHES